MGKYTYDPKYARPERDYYPTPAWCVEALAEYVELDGRWVWECACGDGRMSETLKAFGARVYSTDIEDRGYAGLDEVLDFTAASPKVLPVNPRIITNPPYAFPGGRVGKLAEAFIAKGLHYIRRGGLLALLLPHEFDAINSRRRFFAECGMYAAKITLTRRVVWYERTDGEREDPMGDHAWYVWQHPRQHPTALMLYPYFDDG